MTLTTTINRNDYTATSAQTVFAYAFRILADADLDVYVEGVLKTLTTDYTVSGAGDAGGGNVTFTSGVTLDEAVTIIRSVAQAQDTDYTASGPFTANDHETALDKNMMISQDIDEKLARAIKFIVSSTLSAVAAPEGSSASDRKGKIWGWDNTNGTALALFASTVVDAVSVIATKGDIVQGNASGAAAKLAIGPNGSLLEVVSGLLAYVTAPTISDFTNGTHDHSNTANAGSIVAGAMVAPVNYRSGFNCKQATTVTITVEAGVIDVDGTTVTKTADTTLNLTTATDWVDDTSDQATGTYGYIYINAAGKIEMDNVAPDEANTSGSTSGILRYNDTGTDTSDRRMLGWFYMNATGAGELSTYEVGNLKDGDVHNSVVRTDSTQDLVNDTTYGTDLTNTTVHFYSSGRGTVAVKCHMDGTSSAASFNEAILDDGSNIVPSQDAERADTSSQPVSMTPQHAEAYVQGGITFKAQAKVSAGTYTVEEKTVMIQEN